MSRWQAVVFDLDDTLYPERQYVLGGLRAAADWACRTLGVPADRTCAELCGLFDEGVRGNTFDRWLADRGWEPAAWVPAMCEAYRGHEPEIAPFADVLPLIERLRGRCLLGLVTDGPLDAQRRKWTALALAPYFQSVVFSDALGRDAWKPSPRPFQAILQHFAIPGPQAMYVADNPAKDFRGARLAGMATVRIRRPEGLYYRLEPLRPDDAPDAEIVGLGELGVDG